MSLKNINTWAQGYFVDQRQYSRWSDARKAQAHKEEQCKVRPSPTGNAICICATPEDAKWIADRLNLTVKLERDVKNEKIRSSEKI